MSLHYRPITPPSLHTSSSSGSRSLNYIDKFKLKRHVQSELNSLRKNIKRQHQIYDESISRMLSCIIGDDPLEGTASLDLSITQRSMFLSKEDAAMIGESNILTLLSSDFDSESILNYYKKGFRSLGRLSQTNSNTMISRNGGGSSPKLMKYLNEKKAKIHKQRGIKILIRMMARLLVDRYTSFLKICLDGDFNILAIKTPRSEDRAESDTKNPISSIRGTATQTDLNKDEALDTQRSNRFANESPERNRILKEINTNFNETRIKHVSDAQQSDVMNSNLTSFVDNEGMAAFLLEKRGSSDIRKQAGWSQEKSFEPSPPEESGKANVKDGLDNKENVEHFPVTSAFAGDSASKKKKPLGSYSANKSSMLSEIQKERKKKFHDILTPQRELMAQIEETSTPNFLKGSTISLGKERGIDMIPKNLSNEIERHNRVNSEPSMNKIKKEKLFFDTLVLWALSSQKNDIKPEDLVKVIRIRNSRKVPKKVEKSPGSSKKTESLAEWDRSRGRQGYGQFKLSFTKKNPQLKSEEVSFMEEDVREDRGSWMKENEDANNESFFAAKLKTLKSDLLSFPTHAKRKSEGSHFFDKVLKLTEKIKSTSLVASEKKRSKGLGLSENLESPNKRTRSANDHALRDITMKLTNTDVMDFQRSTLAQKVLDGFEPQGNYSIEEEKKKKGLPFAAKLKSLTRLVTLLLEQTHMESSFNKIKEFPGFLRDEERELGWIEKRSGEVPELGKFFSFSNPFGEPNMGGLDVNKVTSPGFSEWKQQRALNPKAFQGILKAEGALLRFTRRYYRLFFDSILEMSHEIVEEEQHKGLETPEKVEEFGGFPWKRDSIRRTKLSVSREFSNDNLREASQEELPVGHIEEPASHMNRETPLKEEEDFAKEVLKTMRKREDDEHKGEEEPANYEAIGFGIGSDGNQRFAFGSLEEKVGNIVKEGGWANSEEDIRRIVTYLLQRPEVREELKMSLNFSNLNEEDPTKLENWKQSVEQNLESTLERKLELKLMQMLEEKLDSRIYTHREGISTKELHTEERDSELRFPSFVSRNNKKETYRSANLTASKPFFHTMSDMKHSYAEFKENEMDGSMQKFIAPNEESIREIDESQYMDDHYTKPSCLDEVLYIYQNAAKSAESQKIRMEDLGARPLEVKEFQPQNEIIKEFKTGGITERNPFGEEFSDDGNDILRELEPRRRSERQVTAFFGGGYKMPERVSRNVHHFYILEGILNRKVKERLYYGLAKMKEGLPAVRVSPHKPFSLNPVVKSYKQRYQEKFYLPGPMGDITERSSETHPTSVSFSMANRNLLSNTMELVARLDRIQMKMAFELLREEGQETPLQELTFNKVDSMSRGIQDSSIQIQNIFWLVNVLQRKQWRNLKWGFANLYAQIMQQREKKLRCLVLISKLDEVYSKLLRNGFTKICYYHSETKEAMMAERSMALDRLSQVFSKGLKRYSLGVLRSYAGKQVAVKESLTNVCEVLKQSKLETLQQSFTKLFNHANRRKRYGLYMVKLAEVLTEIRESKLRLYFFQIKQRSQNIYIKSIEQKSALRRVLNQKVMRDYIELKNFLWKWKINRLMVDRRRDHRMSRENLFTKEKAYLGRCLHNVLKRGLKSETRVAFNRIKEYSTKVDALGKLSTFLGDKMMESLEMGIETLREHNEQVNEELKLKIQSIADIMNRGMRRGAASFFLKLKEQEIMDRNLEQHEKVNKMGTALTNLMRNHLHKGLRMIELAFISKKNRESLYMNLALKTMLLLKTIRLDTKRDFFNILASQYEKEVTLKKFFRNVFARKHIKSLSYFFNKFKTRALLLKANKSALRLLEKNIAVGADKLVKFYKDQMMNIFRRLKPVNVKTRQTEHIRPKPAAAVIAIDFSMSLPQKKDHAEISKHIVALVSIVEKLYLKRKALAFRFITSKAGQDVKAFTPRNHLQYYLQSGENREGTIKASLSLDSPCQLDSFDEFPRSKASYENEEKITKRRKRKYFTDWRLAYIKSTNKKDKLISAINKVWNIAKRHRVEFMWWSFNVLVEAYSNKPKKIQLVYVPYSSSVKQTTVTKASEHHQSRLSSYSPIPFNQSKDRFTPSPSPIQTQPERYHLITPSNKNMFMNNLSPTSTNYRASNYSISPTPQSGRGTVHNPSVSPNGKNKKHENNRSPSLNKTGNLHGNLGNKGLHGNDKVLHMQPVYSIVSKKEM